MAETPTDSLDLDEVADLARRLVDTPTALFVDRVAADWSTLPEPTRAGLPSALLAALPETAPARTLAAVLRLSDSVHAEAAQDTLMHHQFRFRSAFNTIADAQEFLDVLDLVPSSTATLADRRSIGVADLLGRAAVQVHRQPEAAISHWGLRNRLTHRLPDDAARYHFARGVASAAVEHPAAQHAVIAVIQMLDGRPRDLACKRLVAQLRVQLAPAGSPDRGTRPYAETLEVATRLRRAAPNTISKIWSGVAPEVIADVARTEPIRFAAALGCPERAAPTFSRAQRQALATAGSDGLAPIDALIAASTLATTVLVRSLVQQERERTPTTGPITRHVMRALDADVPTTTALSASCALTPIADPRRVRAALHALARGSRSEVQYARQLCDHLTDAELLSVGPDDVLPALQDIASSSSRDDRLDTALRLLARVPDRFVESVAALAASPDVDVRTAAFLWLARSPSDATRPQIVIAPPASSEGLSRGLTD